MNKSELVQRVAEKAEMSRAAAAKAVDAIFDATAGAIGDIVDNAGKLSLPGFGKFESKKRPGRKGRNPRTGAEIDIPERNVVTFTPGKALKERVAGGGGTKTGRGGASAKAGAKAAGATTTKAGGARGGATKTAAGGAKGGSKAGGAGTSGGGGAKGGGSATGKTGGSKAKK